jgi:hypothetical protein
MWTSSPDGESVAIPRLSVPAAHFLQTPRRRASLSSRSTKSSASRPSAGAAGCRRGGRRAIPSHRDE